MDIISRLLAKFKEYIPISHRKRRCRYKGCKTILSQYDKRKYCYFHHQALWEKKPYHNIPIKKELDLTHRKHIANSIKKWWRKRKNETQ